MSAETAPPPSRDAPPGPRGFRFALLWFAVAFVAMFGALWSIVLIEPIGWRFLTTLPLTVIGIAALMLFSDVIDRSWRGPRRHWVVQAVHWLTTAVVTLAFAITLGAFVPSLAGFSPATSVAILADIAVGLVAGLLTLALSALSAWAVGWLWFGVQSARRASDEQARSLQTPLRGRWSWRLVWRAIAVGVAGVLLSALVAQLLTPGVPKNPSAADTAVRPPSALTTIWLPLAAWFLATSLVWLFFDKRVMNAISRSHPRRRRATHANALAVGLAIAIAWGFAWFLDDYVRDKLSTGRSAVNAVSIQNVPTAQRSAYLAQQFAPQLTLAPGELWEPTTVDWYLANSTVENKSSLCAPQGADRDGCRELTCKGQHAGPCTCDESDPGSCVPTGRQPHAVYYRYIDATNTKDRPARPGHQWAVIQYWIFYNYDSLGAGVVTQWHQSDWEQVSVLVVRRGETVSPVEVAFSEHCYGAVVPAAKVTWNGSHPESYVGLGSHANYPTRNDLPIRQLQCLTRKNPRYLGAAGLFFNPHVDGSALELPLAYLNGLRDRTGPGERVTDVHPISMQATPTISGFHGYWGIDNNLTVLVGRARTGAGPQSPQDQNPSLGPFRDMLCGQSWIRVSPVRASDTNWVC